MVFFETRQRAPRRGRFFFDKLRWRAQKTCPSGASVCSRRVVRGGSWSNDATWLRSANRNNNSADNDNNNVGFRVACSSTLPRALKLTGIADQGLRCAARARKMARVHPVCTALCRQAHIKPRGVRKPDTLWPRMPLFFFRKLRMGLIDPAAQQATDFSDHAADVLILPVV